ncbi:response regulator [Desulfonauticus submarinus]
MKEQDKKKFLNQNDKISLLIVEDDIALRQQLVFLLQKEFSTIDTATTLKGALTKIKFNPQIIILDLGLPPSPNSPEQGLLLLGHLKSYHKVIILTGQTEENTIKTAIQKNICDFLIKPILPDIILHSVRSAKLFLLYEKKLLTEEGMHKLTLTVPEKDGIKHAKEYVEKSILEKILLETNFNIYQTAKRLGLRRQSIYYFIKKFNIKKPST